VDSHTTPYPHTHAHTYIQLIAGFQPRYFELRADDGASGAVLMYALPAVLKEEEDVAVAARGSIRLSDARVEVETGSSRNFTVTSCSTSQLFARIRCESERERAEWITALELAQRGQRRSPSGTTDIHKPVDAIVGDDETLRTVGDHTTNASADNVPSSRGEGQTLLSMLPSTDSSGGGCGTASAALDITESECTSDDSVDELDGEHSVALRRIFLAHSNLRKRCESLVVKLASVSDGSDDAALPTSAILDFERTYSCLLGASSDLVNDGIRVSHWLSERLREATDTRDEIERQSAAVPSGGALLRSSGAPGRVTAAGAARHL
jgi:hypothetical protein